MGKKDGMSGLKAWLIVLVALLDDIIALALVFLLLTLFDVNIPVPVLIVIGLVLGAVIFIAHRAVVPSLRRRKITGAEGMIGATGKVTEQLNPEGTVIIYGEYWKAACLHGTIEKGREVEVVAIKGLGLEVKEKEN